MASDVTLNNALDFSQRTATSSAKLADDFNEFLILLTTQLQNQDPLSPMDSTEFTNQLVNFAGVEQQINANQKLDSLVSLMIGSAFSTTIGYIGKDISYISSEAHFDGSKPVEINYAIEGASSQTKLNIYDADNKLIFSKDITASDGTRKFVWDGKDNNGNTVENGTYSIRVDALDAQNEALKTTTVVSGRVTGVETQNGTTMLLVGDRAISIGTLINVKEAPATPTTTETTSS